MLEEAGVIVLERVEEVEDSALDSGGNQGLPVKKELKHLMPKKEPLMPRNEPQELTPLMPNQQPQEPKPLMPKKQLQEPKGQRVGKFGGIY